ncbi:hypothetical protein RSAG8_07556, partial [Rhizoctonia solani AG-8 WAC10335]
MRYAAVLSTYACSRSQRENPGLVYYRTLVSHSANPCRHMSHTMANYKFIHLGLDFRSMARGDRSGHTGIQPYKPSTLN